MNILKLNHKEIMKITEWLQKLQPNESKGLKKAEWKEWEKQKANPIQIFEKASTLSLVKEHP